MEMHPPEDVAAYPRPPALQATAALLRVVLADHIVAETRAGLRVLETHHAPTYYFPPGDILARLTPSGRTSWCEWKGRAAYHDVTAAGVCAPSAAWSYPDPTPAFARLRDHVAFYPGLMSICLVDDMQVTPQPGGFYGGWVTPNLRGIVKGAPGTERW